MWPVSTLEKKGGKNSWKNALFSFSSFHFRNASSFRFQSPLASVCVRNYTTQIVPVRKRRKNFCFPKCSNSWLECFCEFAKHLGKHAREVKKPFLLCTKNRQFDRQTFFRESLAVPVDRKDQFLLSPFFAQVRLREKRRA